ncbi:MAG: reverse gyrase [Nitrososphaerota archaeon]|nr:reverse gyrase [Candidatus Bathyarchaeota archaeon]MDW8193559.1 reverse gyrase [Nitrososphaerota archaeon]
MVIPPKIEGLKAVYKGMCPNCGGDITDQELLWPGVCTKCLPQPPDDREKVYSELVKLSSVSEYVKVLEVNLELRKFTEFFNFIMGSKPWALQKVWAKRVLMGRSFSIVAPTGIGKTLFGLVMALFLARNGKKSYIIVPTSLLVKHLLDRVSVFLQKFKDEDKPKVIGYYSVMPKNEAKEIIDQIARNEFSILITTDRFLYSRFDLIRDVGFNFIFVDDVDSFLKSPRNIDKVVLMMGFTQEHIEKALEENGKSLNANKTGDLKLGNQNFRVLVVSGATLMGKRTKRIRIFKSLFGFEPGFSMELVRNISNMFVKPEGSMENQLKKLISAHGSGCLVFVPQVKGVEYAKKLAEVLESDGVKVHVYERMNPKILERFVNGEYSVLVGVCSNRSPLARGLDLPETIRYVVFAGVPRREIRVGLNEYNPQKILTLLKSISPLFENKLQREIASVMSALSRIVPVSKEIVEKVREADEANIELDGFEGYVQKLLKETRKVLAHAMENVEAEKLAERIDVDVKIENGEYVLVIPDVDGYIQASGRVSRFYAAGISRGVSIMIVDDEKSFRSLRKQIQLITDEEFEEYKLDRALEEFKAVSRDREIIRKMRMGEFSFETVDIIKSALVIVESPTKAKAIAYFFGKPARRMMDNLTVYEVAGERFILTIIASGGHVFDLTSEGGYHGVIKENGDYIPVYTDIRRCNNCGEQFTDKDACPECGSSHIHSTRKMVNLLRKLATEANKVFIATDPDVEGEKISYDIFVSISPYCNDIERLEFHEVTRRALKRAFEHPRKVKLPLVQAQVVRRIEDRWVGFELSQKLWKKFKKTTLSAGRVQTPVLGWVISRTAEMKHKIPIAHIRLENDFSITLENPSNIEELTNKFKAGNLTASIDDVAFHEAQVYPPPPYTTDSMLRDAARRLGFSVGYTMSLAQTLFESGLITYHRTDATTVSTTGMDVAKRYVDENFPGTFKPREYKAEGAHECIRPTKPIDAKQLRFYLSAGVIRVPQKLVADHMRLYEMIFKRFIASQMKEAKIQTEELTFRLNGIELRQERITRILEEGFLKINPILRVKSEVKPGRYRILEFKVRRKPAAGPYREGDLVALMKEKGIGRPSTYSKIINVLLRRGYIINRNGFIFNTKLGKSVYDYLAENFKTFISEELTRNLEKAIDAIESGKTKYTEILRSIENDVRNIIVAG